MPGFVTVRNMRAFLQRGVPKKGGGFDISQLLEEIVIIDSDRILARL